MAKTQITTRCKIGETGDYIHENRYRHENITAVNIFIKSNEQKIEYVFTNGETAEEGRVFENSIILKRYLMGEDTNTGKKGHVLTIRYQVGNSVYVMYNNFPTKGIIKHTTVTVYQRDNDDNAIYDVTYGIEVGDNEKEIIEVSEYETFDNRTKVVNDLIK